MTATRLRRAVAMSAAALAALTFSCSPIEDPVASGPGGTTRGGTTPLLDNPAGTVPLRLRPSPPGAATLAGISLGVEEVGRVSEPTAMAARPSVDDVYVAEKGGRVRVVQVRKEYDGKGGLRRITYDLQRESLLDINREVDDEGAGGLLGLAFNSDGRKLYVLYTGTDARLHLVEYRIPDDRIDTKTRRELLSLDHQELNHYGGQVAFGPDGFLYVGLGDGGGTGDPSNNGQDPTNLYGTIIRLDPEGATADAAYTVPDGNPFAAGPTVDGLEGAPEVFAWGLRDPRQFSWDPLTDDLWVADGGDGGGQEIDVLPYRQGGGGRAANLGWNLREGTDAYAGDQLPRGYVPPLHEFDPAPGCAVTGGGVYRGFFIPTLLGVYVYGDTCNKDLWGLLLRDDGTFENAALGVKVPAGELEEGGVRAFGRDNDGELWALAQAGGVYRIIPGPPPADQPAE